MGAPLGVFVPQVALSAVAWLGYGVWVARRKPPRRPPRGATASAFALLVGSGGALALAFALRRELAPARGRLDAAAWALTTLLGLAFVAAQSEAAALLARHALRGTNPPDAPPQQ